VRLTRVNSIMTQATDNHGVYLCFGCAASSLPDVCPPTVPPPVTTPPRMTPSGSKDPHTGLVDHVVGGCEEVSDQAVPIQHDLSPPFKRQRHAPKELYTVPDWNSLPKQIYNSVQARIDSVQQDIIPRVPPSSLCDTYTRRSTQHDRTWS